MRPLSLRLRGAIGIKKGMGLDEITIDLSNLTGLIALSGENGLGKSSVLESLSPYRVLFSRTGALNQHFFMRQSEKDFTFSYEGHIYRTLLKIDAESDRGEGFIWKDGASVVDGKRKSYDAYIENLLGSQFLFQNSVFCAQNSKKLTDLRTGELREMFAEFLRLDRLQGYEATCKQVIGILGGMIQQIENRIGGLRERLTKEGNTLTKRTEVLRETESLEFGKAILIKKIEQRRETIESLKAAVGQNALHLQRKADVETTIKTLLNERAELTVQEGAELTDLRAKYAAVKAEHDKALAVLKDRGAIEGAAARVREIEEGLAGLVALIEEMGADLPVFQKTCHDYETVIAGLRQQVKDFQNSKEIADLDRELARITGQLGNKYDMSKPLADRDETCKSETCSFIVGALKAEKDIPELQFQKRDIEGTLADKKKTAASTVSGIEEQIRTTTHDLKNAQQVLMSTTELLAMRRKDLAAKREEIKALSALSARLPEIQTANALSSEYAQQLSELTEKGIHVRNSWASKREEKGRQIKEQEDRLAEILKSIDGEAETNLKTAQEGMKADEAALVTVNQQIDAQRQALAGIQAELTALREVETEIGKADAEKGRLTGETAEWTYIRNACSKTGLQALEIDGVIPAIVYDANRLLSMTFGPSYSVRIQTQDEDGKEVFQIFVIRDDGDETLLDNLSGGQKVWILKALRLSLTLLSKHKSGRNFAAAFADEEDGALDVENAQTFVSLYRSFMQAGNFESFFYISHKPECRTTADHIINFKKGGVEIQ